MILVILAIFAVTAPQSGYRSTLYLLLLNHFGVCSSFSIAQFLYICNVHCCPFPQVPFSSSECFPGTFLEFSFFLFFCDPEVHCKVASQICPFSMKKTESHRCFPQIYFSCFIWFCLVGVEIIKDLLSRQERT